MKNTNYETHFAITLFPVSSSPSGLNSLIICSKYFKFSLSFSQSNYLYNTTDKNMLQLQLTVFQKEDKSFKLTEY
jgi:hypothetical protein